VQLAIPELQDNLEQQGRLDIPEQLELLEQVVQLDRWVYKEVSELLE